MKPARLRADGEQRCLKATRIAAASKITAKGAFIRRAGTLLVAKDLINALLPLRTERLAVTSCRTWS